MSLRLIEIVIQKKHLDDVRNFLECHDIIQHKELNLASDKMLVRILLEAEQAGPIINFIETNYANKNNRLMIIPVEAILPRTEEDNDTVTVKKQKTGRISAEELYEDIKNSAKYSKTYIIMLILATIVAAIGLHNNSVVAIIGAMVIAPLLGPTIAISLGVILGESKLLLRAIVSGLIGVILVIALSIVIGTYVELNPTLSEITSRTTIQQGTIIMALASGCAGALAFSTGVAETIIGVMVAVSLLPPLVTFGLLTGGGYPYLAIHALELFIINITSVIFASTLIFLLQKIHPINWKKRSTYQKTIYIITSLGWILVLFLILIFFKFDFLTPV